MANVYGNGDNASINGAGVVQFNDYHYRRKALIDTEKQVYFSQLGDTVAQPKNYGKELVRYSYVPVLDDRNINDQGLDATGAVIADGNLYGSSKDPGVIAGKLPTLTEDGGRVNRFGFTRQEIRGDISQYGMFYEWTEEAMMFDTDKELMMHLNREALRMARELNEDIIQMDLLSAASTIRYTGDATSMATIGYHTNATLNSLVTYGDFIKLDQQLTAAYTPRDTKAIVGSQLTDVQNIAKARYMFVGPDMRVTLEKLTDYFGKPAFVPIENYAKVTNSGKYINALNGEIGAVGPFRIVEVPEMMYWQGGGEALGASSAYHNDGSNYNVYPMLVVGDGSFSHIMLQGGRGTAGHQQKFKIITRKPGTFADTTNPYENVGYTSLQFWQGTVIDRPERIGLILTMAEI
jgi:N4-gp56 family major capsid protein